MTHQPASRHSAFYWRTYERQIDWRRRQFNENSRVASSEVIERRRNSGEQGINALKGNVR